MYATGRSSRLAGRSEIDRPETIEETGELVEAAGGSATALVVDHEDSSAVAGLVERIESDHGRLDVLVNDMFGGDRYAQWDKPLWEHDLAGGLRMLRMGVDTHLITAHHALPLMLKTASEERPGLVVEMTDGTFEFNASFRERVGFYYDLVKANVQRIVVGLTFELRQHPIVALAVTPGWLRSEKMLNNFGVTEQTWRDALAKPAQSANVVGWSGGAVCGDDFQRAVPRPMCVPRVCPGDTRGSAARASLSSVGSTRRIRTGERVSNGVFRPMPAAARQYIARSGSQISRNCEKHGDRYA